MLEQANADVDLENVNCPQRIVYDEMSELSPDVAAIIEQIEIEREYLETCGGW